MGQKAVKFMTILKSQTRGFCPTRYFAQKNNIERMPIKCLINQKYFQTIILIVINKVKTCVKYVTWVLRVIISLCSSGLYDGDLSDDISCT